MSSDRRQRASDERYKIVRPEPIIRADAMAYLIFERQDPVAMSRFLVDFGFLLVKQSTDNPLYFRGHGPSPYLVAIQPSNQDRFKGFGVVANSAGDLETLSNVTGVLIEAADGPGGGRRVRLTDPHGLCVDVVHGITPVEPLPTRGPQLQVNTPINRVRVNAGVRTPVEPSPIFHLGHVVLQRPNFQIATDWYMRHLGILASDVQLLPDGTPGLGFFRFDRGLEPVDHHSIAILTGPVVNSLHVAFETLDLEAVGQGHQYLRARGWTPYWGIGRHVLGSQIFDYWKDPIGDEWEHYADGDVFDARHPTGYHELTRGTLWAWGDDLPDSMRPDISMEEVEKVHAAGGFGAMDLEHARNFVAALQVRPRPWMR